MTKNLAQSFISLRDFGLASQAIAELRLDHAERRFNVAALMVLLEEPLLIERKIMKQLPPKGGFGIPSCAGAGRSVWSNSPCQIWFAVALKRDIRHSVMVHNRFQIICRQVCLISTYFLHGEILRRGIDKRFEVFDVCRISIGDLNSGHDVCLNAANQMHLYPIAFRHQLILSVFGINPLVKTTSRKAGRIDSKITFNRLQRQTARFDQSFEQWRQPGILQVARDGIVVRGLR